jgi:hypothetical protein
MMLIFSLICISDILISMKLVRTSILLSEQEKEAIRVLRQRYGLSTDSDAIRMALNILVNNPILYIQPPEPLKPGPKPKAVRSENE